MNEIGIFLIHGFAGNLMEIAPLEDFLIKKGYPTKCTVLAGHMGCKSDMAKATYKDWLKSAQEDFNQFSKQYKKVVIIGFSAGGLIGINLQSKFRVDTLITLNTPIYHWDFNIILLNIINDFRTKNYSHIKNYLCVSTRIPFSALINFKILLAKTKPLLRSVTCPIFINQSLQDDTVKKRSAKYIYENVSSKIKNIKYYKNSGHIICLSQEKDALFREIYKNIQALTSTTA